MIFLTLLPLVPVQSRVSVLRRRRGPTGVSPETRGSRRRRRRGPRPRVAKTNMTCKTQSRCKSYYFNTCTVALFPRTWSDRAQNDLVKASGSSRITYYSPRRSYTTYYTKFLCKERLVLLRDEVPPSHSGIRLCARRRSRNPGPSHRGRESDGTCGPARPRGVSGGSRSVGRPAKGARE